MCLGIQIFPFWDVRQHWRIIAVFIGAQHCIVGLLLFVCLIQSLKRCLWFRPAFPLCLCWLTVVQLLSCAFGFRMIRWRAARTESSCINRHFFLMFSGMLIVEVWGWKFRCGNVFVQESVHHTVCFRLDCSIKWYFFVVQKDLLVFETHPEAENSSWDWKDSSPEMCRSFIVCGVIYGQIQRHLGSRQEQKRKKYLIYAICSITLCHWLESNWKQFDRIILWYYIILSIFGQIKFTGHFIFFSQNFESEWILNIVNSNKITSIKKEHKYIFEAKNHFIIILHVKYHLRNGYLLFYKSIF